MTPEIWLDKRCVQIQAMEATQGTLIVWKKNSWLFIMLSQLFKIKYIIAHVSDAECL